MMMILILWMICNSLAAPPVKSITLFVAEELNPYESIWDVICRVESNYNPTAVGDTTIKYHSYGIVQIRQSRLDDYYQRTGIQYTERDMFNVEKSKQVFMYYACEISHTNPERISREWNGGPKGMKKKSTIRYWNKVKKYL